MNLLLWVGLKIGWEVVDKRMSELAKVRLVRCPKCENLLPELTDYSVYLCGGCGAVLRGAFLQPFSHVFVYLIGKMGFLLEIVFLL